MRTKQLLIGASWLALAIALPAQAVDSTRCVTQALNDALGRGPSHLDKADDYSFYENASAILFLADGITPSPLVRRIAEEVRTSPQTRIVRTDIEIPGSIRMGNMTSLHMDNTKPFPFSDNEFDRIVMRRGLCLCHEIVTCGGFCPNREDSMQFFSEVVRVLNKKRPGSKALLHGSNAVEPKIQDLWRQILNDLERKYSIQATLLYQGPYFIGVQIETKNIR